MVGTLIFSLQFKPVQTWAAKKAAVFLADELKTRVEIGSLYLKPFKSLVLEGLLVEDLEGDTLLLAPELEVDIDYFAPFSERRIDLDYAELTNAKFFLKSYKDSTTNLTFIINYFDSGVVDTTKKKRPFNFSLNNILIKNLDFRYINYLSEMVYKEGIDYNNIHLWNFSADINDLDTKNHLFKAQIHKLRFKEKTGFVLNNLTGALTIDTNSITVENMLLQTPSTTLTDYYSMRFKSFKDFQDFNNKVTVEAHFKNAKVVAKDIAYFAPQLAKMDLVLDVTGTIKGRINNLKARDLTIKAGQATYIKGDFNLRGLPDWDNTFLDLRFDQVYSNKKDIDYILGKATGNKVKAIPAIIDKFGNINFNGQFTGFQNDFIAYGEFKTKLGRLKSDINMKIDKAGIPSYTGNLQAFDFNIGDLTGQPTLNRTSFTVDVKGRDFELNNLYEEIAASVRYFDFKGYRYSNIKVDGTINKQLFDGKVKVNDKNLLLDFNGLANLNPTLPEFKFKAQIRQANLHKLNLYKDTIQIDADFTTDFTGNSLDNIQGNLELSHVKATTKDSSFVIDSVFLRARGIGKDRLLALTSDIGDASIKGQYDLATLPSAFKTVVKKYIPSLKTKIVPPKDQNFEFNIDLKNFDYVSNIFFPQLKIPERGVFNGKFDSKNNLVNLNGYVKTIKYNNMVFNNLIIDQNTNPKSFEAILSLDKVEFSENGLFVQNIVLQNTLKSDSLTFNVKLSDKDAVNQLDLYGLVEFGSDTLAKVSVLPSDIIIDNQIWKVEDQASIKFEENKTIIEGFELSNSTQLVAVNGAISASEDDLLEIVIENLQMSSLSQLTKNFGVELKGIMNGTANLSAILGNPNIGADITVDSLRYNRTEIGFVRLASAYDNEENNINIKASVEKNNKKTTDITGIVDFKSETNNLDLTMNLDQTELILFEPFVKSLITKLKGNVSSDLKITGKFSNPQIDGDVKLDNAGFMVNYLKTSYTINDDVSIDNSLIRIEDLEIVDAFKNKAIANGSVDLKNPSNPLLDISVKANNFMALNTTSKDNGIYYGTAFGTGTFTFKGPTAAMNINIKAKTEEGTVFTIPLNNASTIGNNDFITYVAKDTSLNKTKKENFFNGLTMEFELEVGQTSITNILTEVGNLSGKGDGQLRLRITSLGDFEMFGDYIINEGKFDFTANNVINKTFDIRKGGTIRWTGDPSDANINLNAVYSTRASLLPLYQAAGTTLPDDQRNLRVLAEAEMMLKGSLLNPDIAFNLAFPNNTDIKTRLQGYLDNEDNEAQQVINLVVRNSFNGNSGGGIGFTNNDLLGSGLELAFSKINNIISQSLNIKNLDINVRSQNEIGGSYSFFNNRLRITGNFVNNRYSNDVLNNNLLNSNLNDLTRDVEMSFNINKDGSFVAKSFQRPTNQDLFNLNTDLYVNGFGLVYTQEYDTFKEFIRNTFARGKREAESKENAEDRRKTLSKPIIATPKEEEEN
ncbi:hypothetical protein PBAC_10500 [Pedobacter glucosidilyticus]|nr:translocation/assembly module TamB domain-containing protein [Pedobacter glucosidilyticus]KHJ38712.1 hypothetical protein PBAC_10500 [Pedobacter glucosidilyticus]